MVAELSQFRFISDVLLDDRSRNMVLDLHVVIIADGYITDDNLRNGRILGDRDAAR